MLGLWTKKCSSDLLKRFQKYSCTEQWSSSKNLDRSGRFCLTRVLTGSGKWT
ncbi:hypothetical protein V5799_013713, partial [Amblyomma americanum]